MNTEIDIPLLDDLELRESKETQLKIARGWLRFIVLAFLIQLAIIAVYTAFLLTILDLESIKCWKKDIEPLIFCESVSKA